MENNNTALDAIREAYETSSKTASDRNFNLCYLGIIFSFIFAAINKTPKVNMFMDLAMICFFISFAINLLQYITSALIYYTRYLRKKDFILRIESNELINLPIWILFFLKFIPTILGVFFIVKGIFG
jgi:hypothetical protein